MLLLVSLTDRVMIFPVGLLFVIWNVSVSVPVLEALPVQYKPAYIMLEQSGKAPFSSEKFKNAEDEFHVLGSPSISTYFMSLSLGAFEGPANNSILVLPIMVKSPFIV